MTDARLWHGDGPSPGEDDWPDPLADLLVALGSRVGEPDRPATDAATADLFRRVVQRACGEVGGCGAVLATGDLVQGLEVVATTGFDAADVDPWRHIGAYEPLPLAECLRHDRRVEARGPEDRAARYPLLARASVAADSTACVPLRGGSRTVGVLGVAFRGARALDEGEWGVLETLAAACVFALEGPGGPPAFAPYGPAPDLRHLHDPERLARADRLGLDDGDPGEAVRRLTALASRQLGLVRAQVSLVGDDVRVAAAAGGTPATARRVPLEQSPCAVAVASGAVLEVADAGRHPWLCDLPVVRSGRVQRYLGVPLVESGGFALGTLCAYDDRPGPWPAGAGALLSTLGEAVVAQFELRATRLELSRVAVRMGRVQALTEELAAAGTVAEVAAVATRHAASAGADRAWLGGPVRGAGRQRSVPVGTGGVLVTFGWDPGAGDLDAQFAPAERLVRQAGLRVEG